jgi:hypothetical protein
MTEAEWLACEDPEPMLEFLRGKASDRKLRLFAVACARQQRLTASSEKARKAAEAAEQFADGLVTRTSLRKAYYPIYGGVLTNVVLRSGYAHAEMYVLHGLSVTRPVQASVLRDIVGNPFHAVTPDPVWLTSTVVELARGIYAERAFDRLPILADALQDAGCEAAEVLDHCRGPGPHARGCWVVDLLLGKS